MDQILIIIIVAGSLSLLLNIIIKKLNMPPILGYMLSGFLITIFFDIDPGQPLLQEVAEFGIVFLLFTIGIEFSMENLAKMKKEVLVHGTLQFFITAFLFFLISHYVFLFSIKSSILTGSGLALSSTAIVLKFFTERGELKRAYAGQSLGILIFQDMSVIPILLLIGILAGSDQSIEEVLFKTARHAVIIFIILYIFGKYILKKFLALVSDTNSHEIFIASVLLLVIGSSYFAHYMGFSYSLGAFLAGLMIAETPYKYQIEADLTPFRDLLLGLFFVSVGMHIDFRVFLENYISIISLVIIIMIIKALIIYSILRFTHWHSTSLKSGVALSQIGEFSFVIFELANKHNLIKSEYSSFLIMIASLSMLITPFILNKLESFLKFGKLEPAERLYLAEPPPPKMYDHIIVCGYGFLSRKILEQLQALYIPYIAIEFQRGLVETGRAAGHNVMFGNASQASILKKAGIDRALGVIIAVEDEKKAALISERAGTIRPDLNIVMKSAKKEMFNYLKSNPSFYIIDENEEMARQLIHYVISCDIK